MNPPVCVKPEQFRAHSEELVQLSRSVVAGADRAAYGVLDKELPAKLKRLEKLAKQIRGELSQ